MTATTSGHTPGSPVLFAEKYNLERLPGFDSVPRDIQDALEKFNGETEQTVHSFLGTLESQEPPPII